MMKTPAKCFPRCSLPSEILPRYAKGECRAPEERAVASLQILRRRQNRTDPGAARYFSAKVFREERRFRGLDQHFQWQAFHGRFGGVAIEQE
jgi:hypothetical protein